MVENIILHCWGCMYMFIVDGKLKRRKWRWKRWKIVSSYIVTTCDNFHSMNSQSLMFFLILFTVGGSEKKKK